MHRVKQETLVGLRLLAHKGRSIEEVHIDRANLHISARYFGTELERNAFVRLDTQSENIWFNLTVGIALFKEHQWCLLELNSNFTYTLGQVFACAQVEWYVGPTPVVNKDFHRDIGFRSGIGRDAGL